MKTARIKHPTPFVAALAYLRQQGLMPTTAKSVELQQLHADITERAFLCAQVDRADILQRAKDLTGRMLDPDADGPGQKITKPVFRKKMRQMLSIIGYEINPDGELTDITSTKRLNLIATMNTQEAQGYGQFEQANRPAVLKAFPAQELFRLQSKNAPRPWLDKWQAAGGTLYAGRMIATKDDPIWSKPLTSGGFNRFGRAWPPFDFNSGMWIRPVTRGEAVRLGVCKKTDTPKRQKRTYNNEIQQACTPLSKDLQTRLHNQFEGRYRIDESGTVHLIPIEQALKIAIQTGHIDKAHLAGKVNIGQIPEAVREVAPFNVPAHDTMLIDTNHLMHEDKHRADANPITNEDIFSLPALLQKAAKSPTAIHGENRMLVRSGTKEIVLEKRKGRIAIITMYNFKKK